MTSSAPPTRDVVVIGASLGGIEALSALVAQLPADFPASVLVVQHTSEHSPGLLADILARKGALRAHRARDGMALEPGSIVVAPPGRHMLLTEAGIRVVYGPRENRARPAIDPLFRTAAVHYRSRVVGLILTGTLGDGATGLHAIRSCGGAAVVQAPDDAVASEMPRRALELVHDAHTVRLADIGALLDRLVHETAPAPPPVPESLRVEVEITERAMRGEETAELPGRRTDFTCPDCGGTIHRIGDDGEPPRYRCRVGHAYSAESLMAAKDETVEETLWVALQTLEERAQMLESLGSEERTRGRTENAERHEARAREARAHASRLHDLLRTLVAPAMAAS